MSEEYCGEERREAHISLFKKIQEDISILYSKANDASDFIGQAKVIGIVATIIFAGSYLYTYIHVQRSDIVHTRLHQEIRDIETRTTATEKQQLLSSERYEQLLSAINTTNRRLSNLILVMIEQQHNSGEDDSEKARTMKKLYLDSFDPNVEGVPKMP